VPAVIRDINPLSSLITLKTRQLNYKFNLIEKLSYLTGVGFYPLPIIEYNHEYARFIETNLTDPNSYGYRVAQQLDVTYRRLRDDPMTRQAVLNVYNYLEDNRGDRRNVPCTLALQFYLGCHGELNLVAYMRSNDVFLGFPYDVSQFTFLQEVMAYWLKVEIGTYTHVATSLHLYLEHIEVAQSILGSQDELNDQQQPRWDLDHASTFGELRKFWLLEEQIRHGKFYLPAELEGLTDSTYLNHGLKVIQAHWVKKKVALGSTS
jgi:thymidylate synthase